MITASDVARLALDLGKATFDNTFTTVATVQGWMESSASLAAHALPWLPPQVPAVVDEAIGLLGRTRADLRQTVDRCHELLSAMLGADTSPASAHDATGLAPVAPPARRAS